MRYMDVAPATAPNGATAVLLHGKNFCAATWEATIRGARRPGYRVIAPDQIGFCKSTKPERYQYSFQALAENTHALLESLGHPKGLLIGHSTGGMLAARYALMYPDDVAMLVLVNPIGLEDWKALGVPPLIGRSVDRARAGDDGGTHPRLRAVDLLRGRMAPGLRPLGRDAGRPRSRVGPRHRRAKRRADRRHDLHPAGRLRISVDPGADAADDRRQGHDRHRQGRRPARGSRPPWPLSGARANSARRHSRQHS